MIEFYKKENILDDDINEEEFRFNSSTTPIMEMIENLSEIKAMPPKELTEDIKKEYRKADFARIMKDYELKMKRKRKKP